MTSWYTCSFQTSPSKCVCTHLLKRIKDLHLSPGGFCKLCLSSVNLPAAVLLTSKSHVQNDLFNSPGTTAEVNPQPWLGWNWKGRDIWSTLNQWEPVKSTPMEKGLYWLQVWNLLKWIEGFLQTASKAGLIQFYPHSVSSLNIDWRTTCWSDRPPHKQLSYYMDDESL